MNSTIQKMKQSNDLFTIFLVYAGVALMLKRHKIFPLSTSKTSIRTYTFVVHQLLKKAVEKLFCSRDLREMCVECFYGYFPSFLFPFGS